MPSPRRAQRRPLLVGCGVLFLLLAALVAHTGYWGTSVVVRDSEGTTFRYSLPGSGEFEIEYVHSYYGVPAVEHFVADEDGSFELSEVSSPGEAVLDYYEMEGRKEDGGNVLRLVPEEHQRFESLPLIATEKGERTLVVSGERIPLYEAGDMRHLIIRVEENTLSMEVRRLLND